MYCGSSNSTSMLRAAVGFKSGNGNGNQSSFHLSFFFPLSFYFFRLRINPIPDCCVLKNLLGIAGKLDFCCIMGIVLLLIFDV